ncbi:MAG: ROK family protein [Bacteroidales bacterium]|nr:ROK family protein [Bacteroidales bacterium]MBN2819037.1 ROK family protein [Bacteroidales bacterium]
MAYKEILGIDFGGSGIKGAPVDTKKGVLTAERHRIVTPEPASPESVVEVIEQIADHFNWTGPIGIGFPAAVQNGVVKTASNIDKKWIGVNAQNIVSERLNVPVCVVNDADAAGFAEMKFGRGKKHMGTVLLITIGTGIGTVLFSGGELVANTELGHLYLNNGREAEEFAADSARQRDELDWTEWGTRFNVYLNEMHKLFWPELIIVGGGVSKKPEKFIHTIDVPSEIVMAKLKNEAGIIGAALAARKFVKKSR